MIKRKHGFHVEKEKKVVRYYMEEGMEGKWIFYRERNGQEGGEEICLASIDLGEVGSGAFKFKQHNSKVGL